MTSTFPLYDVDLGHSAFTFESCCASSRPITLFGSLVFSFSFPPMNLRRIILPMRSMWPDQHMALYTLYMFSKLRSINAIAKYAQFA